MFPKEGTYVKRYIDDKKVFVIFKIIEYIKEHPSGDFKWCHGKIVYAKDKDEEITFKGIITDGIYLVNSTRELLKKKFPDEYFTGEECLAELI